MKEYEYSHTIGRIRVVQEAFHMDGEKSLKFPRLILGSLPNMSLFAAKSFLKDLRAAIEIMEIREKMAE